MRERERKLTGKEPTLIQLATDTLLSIHAVLSFRDHSVSIFLPSSVLRSNLPLGAPPLRGGFSIDMERECSRGELAGGDGPMHHMCLGR